MAWRLNVLLTTCSIAGTDLESRVGSMHGSFQMVQLDSNHQPVRAFDAFVAPFRFIA